MVRLTIIAAALVVGLSGCTELPPAPGSGGGGGGAGTGGRAGTGGSAAGGGFGGEGGAGGTGATGGTVACIPERGELSETDDIVIAGVVSGFVCAGDCATEDLRDTWSIVTCGGDHEIVLSWTVSLEEDLDLFLFDSEDQLVESSADPTTITRGEETETISWRLQEAQQPYTVEVVAQNTNGARRNYNLEITPTD